MPDNHPTVIGGPHAGKQVYLSPSRMILRTSSGVYMRTAARPDLLFHVQSLTEEPARV